MRELLIDEPGRRPAAWNETLGPDERAVFFTDIRTGGVRDADGRPWRAGRPHVCYVFENAEAARAFCLERVERLPDLRCEVYDRRGRAVLPSELIVHERHRQRLSARWNRRWLWTLGALLLAAAMGLFYVEHVSDRSLGLAAFIGLSCIGTAVRLIQLAVTYPEQSEAAEAGEGTK